jgi:uncharacterized damage-inducible protein DinB
MEISQPHNQRYGTRRSVGRVILRQRHRTQQNTAQDLRQSFHLENPPECDFEIEPQKPTHREDAGKCAPCKLPPAYAKFRLLPSSREKGQSCSLKKTIRIRAHLSGVPQPVETPTRFSGCGFKPAAEADSLVRAFAASLKRSPDTNLFSKRHHHPRGSMKKTSGRNAVGPDKAIAGQNSYAAQLPAALLSAFDTNNRINAYIIENLSREAWEAKPLDGKGRTITAIVAHMHNVRVMWLKAAKHSEIPEQLDRATLTPAQALRGLESSRAALSTMIGQALATDGRIKNFRPDVAGFVGYFIAHDAHHRGQIAMLARQLGYPLSKQAMFGMWEWGSRSR